MRQSIEREAFDPPAGQPATLLSLTLEETYQAQYVRATDLRALSVIALDAALPSGYVPKENTLEMQVNQISSADSGPRMQVQLDLHRTLNRRIDFAAASQMVRGTCTGAGERATCSGASARSASRNPADARRGGRGCRSFHSASRWSCRERSAPVRVLAVDHGERRIGMAISDLTRDPGSASHHHRARITRGRRPACPRPGAASTKSR